MNTHDWPTVPEDARPKKLPINVAISDTEREELAAKGWIVIDTRLLPSRTDSERLEAVKAVLEGIRIGSIEADKGTKDFLDLELYVLGVKGKGAQTRESGDFGKGEIDVLLNFGDGRMSQTFKEKLKALDSVPKVPKKKKVSK